MRKLFNKIQTSFSSLINKCKLFVGILLIKVSSVINPKKVNRANHENEVAFDGHDGSCYPDCPLNATSSESFVPQSQNTQITKTINRSESLSILLDHLNCF